MALQVVAGAEYLVQRLHRPIGLFAANRGIEAFLSPHADCFPTQAPRRFEILCRVVPHIDVGSLAKTSFRFKERAWVRFRVAWAPSSGQDPRLKPGVDRQRMQLVCLRLTRSVANQAQTVDSRQKSKCVRLQRDRRMMVSVDLHHPRDVPVDPQPVQRAVERVPPHSLFKQLPSRFGETRNPGRSFHRAKAACDEIALQVKRVVQIEHPFHGRSSDRLHSRFQHAPLGEARLSE